MKTIIAVIFFGILTYAFDEYSSYDDSVDSDSIYSFLSNNSSECKYEPMANFNLTAYLQMNQTYGTYSKYGSVTVCRVLNTEIKECGSVHTNIYGYYQHRGEIYYYEMICNTTEKSMKMGEYLADCQIVKDTYPDDLQEYYYDDSQTQISNDLQTHGSDDLETYTSDDFPTLNHDDWQSLTSDDPTKFQLYMSVVDTDYKNYAIIYNCMKDIFGIEDNVEILQTNIFGCEDPIKVALKEKGEKFEEYILRNGTYCMSHGRQNTTREEVENNGKQDDKKEK